MDGLRQVMRSAPFDRGELVRQMLDISGRRFSTTAQRGSDMFKKQMSTLLPTLTDPTLKRNLRNALQQYDLMDRPTLTRSARAQAIGAIGSLFEPYAQNVPGQDFGGYE